MAIRTINGLEVSQTAEDIMVREYGVSLAEVIRQRLIDIPVPWETVIRSLQDNVAALINSDSHINNVEVACETDETDEVHAEGAYNSGTLTITLYNVKGENGNDGVNGTNGKSAYECALENGFVGTEEQWLASLHGAQGEKGADGKDGVDGADGHVNVVQSVNPNDTTNAVTGKAVAKFVAEHGGGGSADIVEGDNVKIEDLPNGQKRISATLAAGTAQAASEVSYNNGDGTQTNLQNKIYEIDSLLPQSTTEDVEEELVFSDEEDTEEFVKIGPYGIKAKEYFDINGNKIVIGENEELPDTLRMLSAPVVYNVLGDAKGTYPYAERNYCTRIQLDHLLYGLTKEYNIRFNNKKDNVIFKAPCYTTGANDYMEASFVKLDNEISKEYTSELSIMYGKTALLTWNVKNRCVLSSATKLKKALVLCIGDSITDGQQSYTKEDNYAYRHSFHDIALELFKKDNIDANGGHEVLTLGTKSRVRTFTYNNVEYTIKTFHEGYGGSAATGWLAGTAAQGKFVEDENNKFSVRAWVEKYRTLDDNGVQLYFNTNMATTGTAGANNVGYYADGTPSAFKIGYLVSDVLEYQVCVPTHININLGTNGQTTSAQWEAFVSAIHDEYPNIYIGLDVFDSAVTFFPSLHPEWDDSFTIWNAKASNPDYGINANVSYHTQQFNTQKSLETFYNREEDKVFVLPFFFCTPSVESATYRELDIPLSSEMGLKKIRIPYAWGGLYHINPIGHAYCGYQLYAWLKWTMNL